MARQLTRLAVMNFSFLATLGMTGVAVVGS